MDDRMLVAGQWLLRIAKWINWGFAALFAVALLGSFPAGNVVVDRLAVKYPDADAQGILNLLRLVGVVAILISVAAHVIFARLLAIVATVRGGDPFIADNARRLTAIGWALLAIQLLDLAFGALAGVFSAMGVEWSGWSPSLGGWIAVVMVFVLARVFTIGARMRDDLAGTV